jgi:gamma-glutamylputrescine oxidase
MALLDTDLGLARDSWYAATAAPGPARPPCQGTHRADVAIVGGGFAGVSAALELARRGRRVVLLEAREIGWGASGRNGGQAIHGLACDHAVIEAQLGPTAARAVWDMSIEALDLIRRRCAEEGIDADWQDGYLGVATRPDKARALHDWAEDVAQRYGYPMRRIPAAEVGDWIRSPRYHGAIHDPRSGHLHPLKYCRGLAAAAERHGAVLFEHSPVTRLERGAANRLITGQGEVIADQVLLAGNVYLGGLAPGLSDRIMPVGTYIVCSEVLGEARVRELIPDRSAVCDTNFVLDYFRPTADHRLLYGGRVSYSTRTPANLRESMRRRMVGTFPTLADAQVTHAWGGFVDITMNRAPDFGRLPRATGASGDVYYLQGFSGHGLALTGLAGRLVAEAICGDAERFDTFARLRHRPFPGGRWLRMPALVAGMAWYRLRDLL